MTTWTSELISEKLKTSDAWVARAIYRLATDFGSIPKEELAAVTTASDDKIFFDSLRAFFSANGFFTDRHISLGRLKIRKAYIDYLVKVSND